MASVDGKLWWPKKNGVTGLPDIAREGSHQATLSQVWVLKTNHFIFFNVIHLVYHSYVQKQMRVYTYHHRCSYLLPVFFFLDTFESIPAPLANLSSLVYWASEPWFAKLSRYSEQVHWHIADIKSLRVNSKWKNTLRNLGLNSGCNNYHNLSCIPCLLY